MDKMTNPRSWSSFKTARVIPAVEYLQSQRARMMMMMKLAEATAGVDVYLVASAGFGGGGRGAAPAGRGAAPATTPATPGAAPAPGGRGGGGGGFGGGTPAGRHSTFANLATYPAVNIVPGFNATGYPLSMTFFARPFGEGELLAVARAYQDAAGHHLKHPTLS
jgi:hypothetical protein